MLYLEVLKYENFIMNCKGTRKEGEKEELFRISKGEEV